MSHKQKPVYTRQEWEATKRHFGNVCAYCGGSRSGKKKNLTKEHVIPESMGGMKIRHNIIPACSCCNSEKSSYPMVEWFKEQKFFDEERLQAIFWWIGGGCYTISLKKNWQPSNNDCQSGGKLIPKLSNTNTSCSVKRNTGDRFTPLD